MKKLICYLIVLQFMASCQIAADRTIIEKDIYGYWQLEGEANKDLPWNKIEFINDSNIWIDPCLDTIYHYRQFTVTGDSLILTDHQMHKSIYMIDYLKDSTLVISDFMNVDVRLQFRKFVDLPNMNDEGTFHLHVPTVFITARDLSPDSLDVNVKSVLVNEYYEYVKKEIYILSNDEILRTKRILESYFENKEYEKTLDKDRYPYPFNQYVRQYTAYAENDDIIVEVNLMTSWPSLDGYTSLKKDVCVVYDGGPSYASAKVNLSKGEVVGFRTNGEA